MCSSWWLCASVCLCRLGPCSLCSLHTGSGIRQCLDDGAHSTPVCATWSLQQGKNYLLCAFKHVTKSHIQCNYEGLSLFWKNKISVCVCLCVWRHVTSVRTRAERVKLPLEPVWLATNMAAGRPSMSHGESRSHHINLTRQRRRLLLQFFTQVKTQG